MPISLLMLFPKLMSSFWNNFYFDNFEWVSEWASRWVVLVLKCNASVTVNQSLFTVHILIILCHKIYIKQFFIFHIGGKQVAHLIVSRGSLQLLSVHFISSVYLSLVYTIAGPSTDCSCSSLCLRHLYFTYLTFSGVEAPC